MTELMVGTKKGLFALEGEPGGAVRGHGTRVRGRAGRERDARLAHRPRHRLGDLAVLRPEAVYRRRPGGRVGAGRRRRPARGRRGGARAHLDDRPRRGRRRSSTRAATPACCSRAATAARAGSSTAALWDHPTHADWQPGGGGLCLHSIATWPGDPDRLAVAISAAGVWLTEDGGETWRRGNRGLTRPLSARGRP